MKIDCTDIILSLNNVWCVRRFAAKRIRDDVTTGWCLTHARLCHASLCNLSSLQQTQSYLVIRQTVDDLSFPSFDTPLLSTLLSNLSILVLVNILWRRNSRRTWNPVCWLSPGGAVHCIISHYRNRYVQNNGIEACQKNYANWFWPFEDVSERSNLVASFIWLTLHIFVNVSYG